MVHPGGGHPSRTGPTVEQNRGSQDIFYLCPGVLAEINLGLGDIGVDAVETEPGLGLTEAIYVGGVLRVPGVLGEKLAIIKQGSLGGNLLIINIPRASIISRASDPGVVFTPVNTPVW